AQIPHRLRGKIERFVGGAEIAGVFELGAIPFAAKADISGQATRLPRSIPADDCPERRPPQAILEAGVNLAQLVVALDEFEAAHQRQLVGDGRLQRQQLAEVEARHVRLDRLELAADSGGSVRLEVVEVDMAGASIKAHHDNGAWLLRWPGG